MGDIQGTWSKPYTIHNNNNNNNGTTILPLSRGRSLAWEVTVPDTYADAHVMNTVREAGAAANHACSDQQEHQVQPAIQHSCVRSDGH